MVGAVDGNTILLEAGVCCIWCVSIAIVQEIMRREESTQGVAVHVHTFGGWERINARSMWGGVFFLFIFSPLLKKFVGKVGYRSKRWSKR